MVLLLTGKAGLRKDSFCIASTKTVDFWIVILELNDQIEELDEVLTSKFRSAMAQGKNNVAHSNGCDFFLH